MQGIRGFIEAEAVGGFGIEIEPSPCGFREGGLLGVGHDEPAGGDPLAAGFFEDLKAFDRGGDPGGTGASGIPVQKIDVIASGAAGVVGEDFQGVGASAPVGVSRSGRMVLPSPACGFKGPGVQTIFTAEIGAFPTKRLGVLGAGLTARKEAFGGIAVSDIPIGFGGGIDPKTGGDLGSDFLPIAEDIDKNARFPGRIDLEG